MTTKSPTRPDTKERQVQLKLQIERSDNPWKINPETREIGRQGLAKARAALQTTRPSLLELAA